MIGTIPKVLLQTVIARNRNFRQHQLPAAKRRRHLSAQHVSAWLDGNLIRVP
jgi:hypothetical protein